MTPDPLTSSHGAPKTPGLTSVSSLFTWLGTGGDYDKIELKNRTLRGWRRQISSCTPEGKVNLAVGTLVMTALVGLYVWRRYIDKSSTVAAVKSE